MTKLSDPTLTAMQSLSVCSFRQQCRRIFSQDERKWVVTHECIEKNIDYNDQMFDRQTAINKNRKVDLSKLKKESCANQRELAAQSKVNKENAKRIDALEKLISIKE